MSRRRLLVLTTVHHADDTRVREKLIRTLAEEWDITYATRLPAPSDTTGLEWHPLRGGRLQRNVRAAWRLFFGRYDVAVLHDPETLPAGWLATLLARRTVVFDVHEHIPHQIATKEWVALRGLVAKLAALLLRLSERSMSITLAEAGYAGLFRNPHPVFPNFPSLDGLPELPAPEAKSAGSGAIAYVGDITPQRGALLAVVAASAAAPTGGLVMIGPCDDDLAEALERAARRLGVTLTLTGRLPHPEAMEMLGRARLALSPLDDIPNYRQSLPTKVLEYLALGIPVVASDLPGTRTVAGGRPGVRLVPAADETAWKAEVASAYRDDELLAAARREAPAIRREFGWPAEAVRAFYRGL